MNISHLPVELLQNVLLYLDPVDVTNSSKVSKQWRNSQTESFFRNYCLNLKDNSQPVANFWKKTFQILNNLQMSKCTLTKYPSKLYSLGDSSSDFAFWEDGTIIEVLGERGKIRLYNHSQSVARPSQEFNIPIMGEYLELSVHHDKLIISTHNNPENLKDIYFCYDLKTLNLIREIKIYKSSADCDFKTDKEIVCVFNDSINIYSIDDPSKDFEIELVNNFITEVAQTSNFLIYKEGRGNENKVFSRDKDGNTKELGAAMKFWVSGPYLAISRRKYVEVYHEESIKGQLQLNSKFTIPVGPYTQVYLRDNWSFFLEYRFLVVRDLKSGKIITQFENDELRGDLSFNDFKMNSTSLLMKHVISDLSHMKSGIHYDVYYLVFDFSKPLTQLDKSKLLLEPKKPQELSVISSVVTLFKGIFQKKK